MEHFSVVIAGNNPDSLMAGYDSTKKVDKYVVYEAEKADEYRKTKINAYKKCLDADISEGDKIVIRDCIEEWENMSPMDFFIDISAGYDFDEDGNAISTENPNGKYVLYRKEPLYVQPFILKNGTTSFSAKKKDIDWKKMHLYNTAPHEIAWETVVEKRKPKNDEEEKIFKNMQDKTWYFSLFKTKEEFIKSVTSFWGFAFLSEETGWVELEYHIPQFKWVREFYEKFILPLPDNTVLSLYECVRS